MVQMVDRAVVAVLTANHQHQAVQPYRARVMLVAVTDQQRRHFHRAVVAVHQLVAVQVLAVEYQATAVQVVTRLQIMAL
jgi:hypothetical protein